MTATFGPRNVTLALSLEGDILQNELLMPTADFDFKHSAKLTASLELGFLLRRIVTAFANGRLISN
jgi:hypothetical protein